MKFPGGVRFVLAFLGKIVYTTLVHAGVLELVDEVDSKSTGGNTVPVRARPPAPKIPNANAFGIFTYSLFCVSIFIVQLSFEMGTHKWKMVCGHSFQNAKIPQAILYQRGKSVGFSLPHA